VVGYSAKEQLSTKPTGIITFQWDSVNGETMKLNGFVTPSVTDVYSYDGKDMIPNWHLNAPKIQVRESDGSYSVLYYCADAYNDATGLPEAGWADLYGNLDTACTVSVGGGFWLSQPNGDKMIYVTVKNPIK